MSEFEEIAGLVVPAEVARPRRRPHDNGGRKLDAKGSRQATAWADLSLFIGMRSHRERATFEIFREVEQDEEVIERIAAQREELEQEIAGLKAEAGRVAEEARQLAGEVPF